MTLDDIWNRIAVGIGSTALLFGAGACSQTTAETFAGDQTSNGGDGPIIISSTSGTFEIYGLEGGPFPQGTRTYRLHNSGNSLEVWRMDASAHWLTATPPAGALAPGERALVTVEIDHAFASTLPPGDYPSELVLRSQADPNGRLFMGFELHVLPPVAGQLQVEPASGLVIDTDVNSPATNVDGELIVKNTSNAAFEWGASASKAWLNLTPPSETNIAPGESDTLEVRVDEAALLAFGMGTHTATIDLFDLANPTSTYEIGVTVHLTSLPNGRVTNGLKAEYRFDEGAGNVVHDASGQQPPMDLLIADPTAVTWQPSGLRIDSPTIIASPGSASRLVDQIRQTGEMTAEAWIRPDNLQQDGPARIIGISNGPSLRNFTLAQGLWGGQPSDTFNMRARTTATNLDGMPILSTAPGVATLGLQHLVYIRRTDGMEYLYVNGSLVNQQYKGGDFSNWDSSFRLAIANEIGAARAWQGEMYLMAVYNRALTPSEIQQNLMAGSGASNAGHLLVQPGNQIYLTAIQGQGPTTNPGDFQLANVGGEALDWRVTINESWIGLANTAGTLQQGQTTDVPVNLNNGEIANLPAGQYDALALFRNDTSGHGSELVRVRLNVLVPGGSTNGNRPGPGNTGPTNRNILQTMGGMTITQDGTVIENARIFGSIDIQANNVTIRNFTIDAGNQPYAIRCISGNTGIVIEDGELINVDSAHIYGSGFSAFRLNMHESGGDGFKTITDALVEGCWVHHLGTKPGAHSDCNQTRQGGNLIFRGNFFDLPIDIGAPYKQNAAWIIQTGEGAIDNVLIEGNWIDGGNYSIFVENKWTTNNNLPNYGDPTNVRILNNRFGRNYRFGPLRATSYATVQGNRWDDNDQLMNINN